MSTVGTPQEPRDAITRSTMLARSAIGILAALAITRRMSLAETGLAIRPTFILSSNFIPN